MILAVSLGVAVCVALWPDKSERLYGETKTLTERAIDGAVLTVTGSHPQVRLGTVGDIGTLNLCDGTFALMRDYDHPLRPPVWAAHNNCGGDVILTWDVGAIVTIVGGQHDGTWRVVEMRDTPKWADADLINGMAGQLALQSCYYGVNRMRFVGLSPAP